MDALPTVSASHSAEATLKTFANGEIYCRFEESVRGADVFLVQSTCRPVNDSLVELLIMINAAKLASGRPDHRSDPLVRLQPPGQEVGSA